MIYDRQVLLFMSEEREMEFRDVVPHLLRTFFFVANWAKISLESVLSVTEGVPWLSFDKIVNRYGNLWLKGLWLKTIFLVVSLLVSYVHQGEYEYDCNISITVSQGLCPRVFIYRRLIPIHTIN